MEQLMLKKKFRYKPVSNPKETVALLVGWNGCKWKYLEKFSMLYNELGYDVMMIIPGDMKDYTDITYKTFIQEFKTKFKERSFCVCLFSMNGYSWYAGLLEFLNNNENYFDFTQRIEKVIMDSAPQLPTSYRGSRLFVGMYKEAQAEKKGKQIQKFDKEHYSHPILTPLFTIIIFFSGIIHNILKLFNIQFVEIIGSYWNSNKSIMKYSPSIPHLFLYGKNDGIIYDSEVEEFMEKLKRKHENMEIQSKCFDKGYHVGYLLQNFVEYCGAVESFLSPSIVKF